MATAGDWQKIVTLHGTGVRLNVKISPGASRTRIIGLHGDCLKITVGAPPEKGKANQALIHFLADVLNLPKQAVTLQTGQTASRKTLLIHNLTVDRCLELLQAVVNKRSQE